MALPSSAVSGSTDIPLQRPTLPKVQTGIVTFALVAAFLLAFFIWNGYGTQQTVLYGIGFLLGYTLFHARFGFTSAFRRLLSVGQGAGLRAHMLMLAVASTLFAPILASGVGFFGNEPTASVSPVGVSLIVGAILFGIGMQLGGGCASGTLYAVGGGSSSVLFTLFGFISGSVIGAWHWDFWTNHTPALPPFSLAENTGLGYGGALVLQLIAFAAVAGLTLWIAKKRRPPALKPLPSTDGWKRIIRGSWPLWGAAILLAVLNAATLLVRGQPWGITSAFALWGSKVVSYLGIDVTQWAYWSGERGAPLEASVLADATSVMNFGIILGAMLASAASGAFVLRKLRGKVVAASLIGGLIMGYGARLAYGCNIGAFFSGIASFSLHGWVWVVMALVGTYVGLLFRPLFGLSNPKPDDSVC